MDVGLGHKALFAVVLPPPFSSISHRQRFERALMSSGWVATMQLLSGLRWALHATIQDCAMGHTDAHPTTLPHTPCPAPALTLGVGQWTLAGWGTRWGPGARWGRCYTAAQQGGRKCALLVLCSNERRTCGVRGWAQGGRPGACTHADMPCRAPQRNTGRPPAHKPHARSGNWSGPWWWRPRPRCPLGWWPAAARGAWSCSPFGVVERAAGPQGPRVACMAASPARACLLLRCLPLPCPRCPADCCIPTRPMRVDGRSSRGCLLWPLTPHHTAHICTHREGWGGGGRQAPGPGRDDDHGRAPPACWRWWLRDECACVLGGIDDALLLNRHARTHARTHARMHARTHTHPRTPTQACACTQAVLTGSSPASAGCCAPGAPASAPASPPTWPLGSLPLPGCSLGQHRVGWEMGVRAACPTPLRSM